VAVEALVASPADGTGGVASAVAAHRLNPAVSVIKRGVETCLAGMVWLHCFIVMYVFSCLY
jgi:hypothetical protein